MGRCKGQGRGVLWRIGCAPDDLRETFVTADQPQWNLGRYVALAAIAGLALVLRLGYLHVATDHWRGPPALEVQGAGPRLHLDGMPTDVENLVENLAQPEGWFGGLAPLAAEEEKTAHRAPCYPWILSLFARAGFGGIRAVRTFNVLCGLGAVVCLFLAASRAYGFRSAICAGVLAAIYPFWIVNVGERADGCLTVFWFSASAWLALRFVQTGSPTSGLGFGLAIGLMALTRAALLPFALVGAVWFLVQCRSLKWGWYGSLLATLGLAIAIGPWMLRNLREYDEIVPLADSGGLHLYIGNNPWSNGGPMDEEKLRATFSDDHLHKLLGERNQAVRYRILAGEVGEFWRDDPQSALRLRYAALQRFLLGDRFLQDRKLAGRTASPRPFPEALDRRTEFLLLTGFLAVLALGLLGWIACRGTTGFFTAALWTIPLPYVLSHAEMYAGPRLPWDAVLMVFAGAALAKLWPSSPR